jgi:hypothetical protein
MRRPCLFSVLLGVITSTPVSAQQPLDSIADTVVTTPTPPPPSPGQEHYLQGLRTAGRGVAQIKNGIERVVRAKNGGDTLQLRQAGRRLGGLCVAARGFIVNGRSHMALNAYEAPTRKPARELAYRLDSLAVYARTCQRQAGKTPEVTATELFERIQAYEKALAEFRTAIGLPNR